MANVLSLQYKLVVQQQNTFQNENNEKGINWINITKKQTIFKKLGSTTYSIEVIGTCTAGCTNQIIQKTCQSKCWTITIIFNKMAT